MPVFSPHEDAYGREILAYYRSEESFEIVEREDGYFDVSEGPPTYFQPYSEWPAHQQAAIGHAQGRILDIGCGAGRVGLHLQDSGFNVTGIDASPLAIEVCRLRGLRQAKALSIHEISPQLGTFDTIVMFGNNFGLFGSRDGARNLLTKFSAITSPTARILAESNNPYVTREPAHLTYQEYNRRRGRMPGQLHIRIRFKQYVSPWFDYLIVSPEEMGEILEGTGWHVQELFSSDDTSMFAAVIAKQVHK